MSIKPLPGDVVAQIKSSVVITSLNDVIAGLLTNALDAQATRINVSVDYSRGSCSAEDNGSGIPPAEFSGDGGLGQRHYTSKYPARSDIHGKHGIFLASVASLSLMSVTSHHRDFHSHNSMSIHNSTVLTRNTPCRPEQRLLSFAHGTRVTIRDLFGAMPVRVKHRALQAEKSSFARDWDRLALRVVGLLIPWPGAVSVLIRDSASRQILTFKVGSERRLWLKDSCRLLHQASFLDSPDSTDWVTIGASSPALSINGYVCRAPVATKCAQFISLGIVPLSNESRGNVLHDEVNKVFADSSFGVVEEDSDTDVAPKMSRSGGFTHRELKIRKGVDRWPMFFLKMTLTSSNLPQSLDVDDVLDDRQPSLALIIDLLRAMFYEFLKRNHCRPRKVMLTAKSMARSQREDAGSPDASVTSSAVQSQKRLNTTSTQVGTEAGVTRSIVPSRSRLESPFAFSSKIKSGHPLQSLDLSTPSSCRSQPGSAKPMSRSRNSTPGLSMPSAAPETSPLPPPRSPLFDANGRLTRKPFDDIDPRELVSKSTARDPEPGYGPEPLVTPTEHPSPSCESLPVDGTVEWVNPFTNMVTTINARTGFAVAPRPLTLARRSLEHKPRGPVRGIEPQIHEATGEPASWVKDLRKTWKNPVFEITEAAIPKLPDVVETLGLEPRPAGHHCHHGQASFNVGTRYETTAMGLQGRLSRETLRDAQLIAQVDKKFILSKVSFDRVKDPPADDHGPLESSSVLILIDQHAADERCRVEALMADYFHTQTDNNGREFWKAVTEALMRPVQFELSAPDHGVLLQFQPHFKYWGICYELEAIEPAKNERKKTSRSARTKVAVTSLPPAILERCRTDVRLLAELIRTEAWRLKDENRLSPGPHSRQVSPTEVPDGAPVWVTLFHGCPPGIVDLINSRSCRSAIMFNDPLTLAQCSDLLDRLMRCAFPFQCAHGRPSMVPLVGLGDGMDQLGCLSQASPVGGSAEVFGRAFKRWKGSRY